MNEQSKLMLTKIAEKKANNKAEHGKLIADVGKATTVAQLKAILIKVLTELSE